MPVDPRLARRSPGTLLAAILGLGLGVGGCEAEVLELAAEVVEARGECTPELLRESDEACVRMMERYAGMGVDLVHTYVGGLRSLDRALDRLPPPQFDAGGLEHALSPEYRAGDPRGVGASPRVPRTRAVEPNRWSARVAPAAAGDPGPDRTQAAGPVAAPGTWMRDDRGAARRMQPAARRGPRILAPPRPALRGRAAFGYRYEDALRGWDYPFTRAYPYGFLVSGPDGYYGTGGHWPLYPRSARDLPRRYDYGAYEDHHGYAPSGRYGYAVHASPGWPQTGHAIPGYRSYDPYGLPYAYGRYDGTGSHGGYETSGFFGGYGAHTGYGYVDGGYGSYYGGPDGRYAYARGFDREPDPGLDDRDAWHSGESAGAGYPPDAGYGDAEVYAGRDSRERRAADGAARPDYGSGASALPGDRPPESWNRADPGGGPEAGETRTPQEDWGYPAAPASRTAVSGGAPRHRPGILLPPDERLRRPWIDD